MMSQPSPEYKLFAVYHHHEYGSSQWLLWSKIFPTERQTIELLDMDFEPEKGEYIDVEEIEKIHVLKLS